MVDNGFEVGMYMYMIAFIAMVLIVYTCIVVEAMVLNVSTCLVVDGGGQHCDSGLWCGCEL